MDRLSIPTLTRVRRKALNATPPKKKRRRILVADRNVGAALTDRSLRLRRLNVVSAVVSATAPEKKPKDIVRISVGAATRARSSRFPRGVARSGVVNATQPEKKLSRIVNHSRNAGAALMDRSSRPQ